MSCLKTKIIINKEAWKKWLKEDSSDELFRHFLVCEDCKKAVQSYQSLTNVLKNEKYTIGTEFTANVMDAIRKRATKPSGVNLWKYAAIAASVLLLVVSGFLVRERSLQSEVTVQFALELPGAQSVALAGDFNNWDAGTAKLVNNNGVWSIDLKVKPGRYQYAFVIDGKKWIADPRSEQYVESGFGSKNSILDTKKI